MSFMLHTIAQLDLAAVSRLADIRIFGGSIAGIWVSELASATTVLGLSLVAVLILSRSRRWYDLAGFLTAVAGSTILSLLIKEVVGRPRPPVSLQAYREVGSSFPSMHAVAALTLYGFLAWLVWRDCAPRAWRYAAAFGAIALTLAIGFSRVYLGVHYPSDVLAGYAIGGLFLAAGIRFAKKQPRQNLC